LLQDFFQILTVDKLLFYFTQTKHFALSDNVGRSVPPLITTNHQRSIDLGGATSL